MGIINFEEISEEIFFKEDEENKNLKK